MGSGSEGGAALQPGGGDFYAPLLNPDTGAYRFLIDGEWRGSKGTLIGIDGADGIVKMAENSDIKILYLDACAKLVDQSK